jgi:23S rRNA U2552 (ribose-2'-O)-methylase RlmE/FtsJ
MEPIPGVEFLEGDFTQPETLDALRNLVGPKPVDLVMSDMAPNISGNRAMDQPRSMALLDEALQTATQTRSGTLEDSLLDSAGGLLALLGITLFYRLKRPAGG